MRRTERATSVNLDWPHLRTARRNPLRAKLARQLFLWHVRDLRLSVTLPDGSRFGRGDGLFGVGGDPNLTINDPDVFFSRLGRDRSLGFGEAYLLGAWDCGRSPHTEAAAGDELAAWLAVYAGHLKSVETPLHYRLRSLLHLSHPVSQRNSEEGAVANVQAHYDLDGQLFETFLDDAMIYSSAWFEPGDDLESAQARKVDSILDMAKVGPGTRLLDIGSGFGGLAVRAAAERGASVVGLTLSQNQLDRASSRARNAGLDGRVSFLLEDFRRHSGVYDAVVSVEMIEAVGSEYWVEYFQAVERHLKPGGFFGLQVITFPHRRMAAARNDFSWVDRYVFPGGELPSMREINRILTSHTGLEVAATRRLSDSYAETLKQWRHRFVEAHDAVTRLGFDEIFCRLWLLYFAYFEAGFRARYCDVWQVGIRKAG
jgi:cyclopropane-fatty-acyl-phospholipid synthase